MAENKKNKKVKVSTLIYSAIIVAGVYVAGVGIALYGFGVENSFVAKNTQLIGYPAVLVNFNFIRVSTVKENLAAIRKFYESQDFSQVGLRVDFSTEDGRKRLKVRERQLIQRLIEDKVIEVLARERGVKITAELIDQAVSRKLDEYGSRTETQEKLLRLYGWSLQEFEEKIVKADLYRDELEKKFIAEDKTREVAKGKIEQVEKELADAQNFTALAKKYSEGKSADTGGEMGWFAAGQLIPGLAENVFGLKAGATSSVIETELGFHIVRMDERKKEDDVEMVKISQIFIRKHTFSEWLVEKIKEQKIFVPLKNYFWDQKAGMVQHTSEELCNFEKNITENFTGDASVLY